MADYHEIDELFKARFDGVKDHRVDPNAQWVRFESELEAAMVGSAGATASTVGTSLSSWGMAASVAAIIGVAGLVNQDRSALEQPNPTAERIQLVQAATSWFESSETASDWVSAESINERNNRVGTLDPALPYISDDEPSSSIGLALAETSEEPVFDRNPTAKSKEPLAFARRVLDRLGKMPALGFGTGARDIAARDLPDLPDAKIFRQHGAYVRAGIRTGNGESNSMSDPAKWRLNGVASVGYTYAFSPKTFISAEIGLLRRTGNGLERSQDVDLEPLANVLLNNFGGATEEELELRRNFMNVRESFVAQRLDYVHMPVALHVNLTTHSNASIGTFVDYLIGVENESYMVYNSTDYIKADFGSNDGSTMEGLNRWRLGLMAGYEHTISQHVTIDARAMLPITTVFDRSSEFYQHAEPNQLVDLQVGLNYKI